MARALLSFDDFGGGTLELSFAGDSHFAPSSDTAQLSIGRYDPLPAPKDLLPFSDQVPVHPAADAPGASDVSAETSAAPIHPDAGRDTTGRRILPMDFGAYVELLEWVGRAMHAKATGRIRGTPPAILTDLSLNSEAFLTAVTERRLTQVTALGTPDDLEAHASTQGLAWIRGTQLAKDLFVA